MPNDLGGAGGGGGGSGGGSLWDIIWGVIEPIIEPILPIIQPIIDVVETIIDTWTGQGGGSPQGGGQGQGGSPAGGTQGGQGGAAQPAQPQQPTLPEFEGDTPEIPRSGQRNTPDTTFNAREFFGDNFDPAVLGDGIAAGFVTFLDFVIPGNWDREQQATAYQQTRQLFRLVSGAIAANSADSPAITFNYENTGNSVPYGYGFTPLTTSIVETQVAMHLQEQGDSLETTLEYVSDLNPDELAQLYIDMLVESANELGISLGDIEGLTALEVINIYQAELYAVQWRGGRLDPRGQVVPLPQQEQGILALDPVEQQLGSLHFVESTMQYPVNPDVLLWAYYNSPTADWGENEIPQLYEAEQAIREEIFRSIEYHNLNTGNVNLNQLGTEELTIFYTDLLREAYPDAPTVVPPFAFQEMGYQPVSQYWIQDESVRLNELLAAFEGQYVPPKPDHSLLMLAAQVLIEPFDWVMTGLEVLGDLAEGDYGGALINAGLMILPGVPGWLDDAADFSRAVDNFDYPHTTAWQRSPFSRGGGGGNATNRQSMQVFGVDAPNEYVDEVYQRYVAEHRFPMDINRYWRTQLRSEYAEDLIAEQVRLQRSDDVISTQVNIQVEVTNPDGSTQFLPGGILDVTNLPLDELVNGTTQIPGVTARGNTITIGLEADLSGYYLVEVKSSLRGRPIKHTEGQTPNQLIYTPVLRERGLQVIWVIESTPSEELARRLDEIGAAYISNYSVGDPIFD